MEKKERVVIYMPETYHGNVMTALSARKAILMNMQMMNNRSRLEVRMPSRGLFGYRSQFLTDTHGEGSFTAFFPDSGFPLTIRTAKIRKTYHISAHPVPGITISDRKICECDFSGRIVFYFRNFI